MLASGVLVLRVLSLAWARLVIHHPCRRPLAGTHRTRSLLNQGVQVHDQERENIWRSRVVTGADPARQCQAVPDPLATLGPAESQGLAGQHFARGSACGSLEATEH